MNSTCPFCEIGETTRSTHTELVTRDGRTVLVAGMSRMVCLHCGEATIPLSMYDDNRKLVEAALNAPHDSDRRGS
jgi:YgiT-type zinc finger domain-containing protein